MATRADWILMLAALAAVGTTVVLRNLPRKDRTVRFSIRALEVALTKLQREPPTDGAELEVSTPERDVCFTFFAVDGDFEMRLDSFSGNATDHLTRFRATAEHLGLAPERPGEDDLGHEGEIAVTLGSNPTLCANHAASIIEHVCGVVESSPVGVAATSFDPKWAPGV